MAQPTPIFFTITEAGKNAALDAKNTGLTLRLDRLGVGRAKYTPTGDETALRDEFMRTGITAGDIDEKSHTLRFSSTFTASHETEVWELGLFDEQNRLFAIASRTNKPLLKVYPDIAWVASFGLTLGELDAGSISMVIDPSSAILAANNFDELRRAIEELRKRPFEGIPIGGILTTAKSYNNGDEVAADLGYGKWQRYAQGKVLAGFSTQSGDAAAFKKMESSFGQITKTGATDYHVVAFWRRMPNDWVETIQPPQPPQPSEPNNPPPVADATGLIEVHYYALDQDSVDFDEKVVTGISLIQKGMFTQDDAANSPVYVRWRFFAINSPDYVNYSPNRPLDDKGYYGDVFNPNAPKPEKFTTINGLVINNPDDEDTQILDIELDYEAAKQGGYLVVETLRQSDSKIVGKAEIIIPSEVQNEKIPGVATVTKINSATIKYTGVERDTTPDGKIDGKYGYERFEVELKTKTTKTAFIGGGPGGAVGEIPDPDRNQP